MKRARKPGSHGSTITEVMMAIALLSVGASGIISMQKAASLANRNAKNLEIGNEIARTWIERLRSDATKWNHPSPLNPNSDIDTDTMWLANKVQQQGAPPVWFRPEDTTRSIYGVHDALGKDEMSGSKNGPFCVNMRLGYLRANQAIIRAEIRVYWLRQGVQYGGTTLTMQPPNPLCGATTTAPPAVHGANDVFHFVYATTAIAKNMAY